MTRQPLIIGFDTSGAHVAAALIRGADVVASKHEDMARGQAERLMRLLSEMLTQAGVDWADLDAIGVGVGPGNFTGIRLSVSAARGLALGLGIRAFGVTSFEALAFGQNHPVLAAVPAPRNQAYFQMLDEPQTSQPVLAKIPGVSGSMRRPGMICIAADPELAAIVGQETETTWKVPSCSMAVSIARVALSRIDDPAPPRPTPLYVKPADAAPSRDAPPVILNDA